MSRYFQLCQTRRRIALTGGAALALAAAFSAAPQVAHAQSTPVPGPVDQRLDNPLVSPLDGPLDRPVSQPTTQDLFIRDDIPRGATVRNRPRPDYDPLGVRLGAFKALPSLTVSGAYDDNIFNTENDEESAFVTRLRPNLDVNSDWSRHLIGLSAGADLGFYSNNSDANFTDYNVGARGRYDITDRSNFGGLASYQRLHEGFDSPNNFGDQKEPTEYDVYTLGAQFTQGFNRLNFRPGVTFNHLDYKDVQAVGGGTIDQDDRDRNVYEGSMRVGYQVSPSIEPYVLGRVEATRYSETPDNDGFDRDSNGFGTVIGAAVDFNGIIFGDFFAGYGQRNYDDDNLDNAQAPLFGGILTWNVTRLTTIIARADYRFEETDEEDASVIKSSAFQLNLDHELLRNVILGAETSYVRDNFDGISREEDTYAIGLTGDYLVNNVLSFGAFARHRTQDGSGGAEDYDENIVGLQLRLQR